MKYVLNSSITIPLNKRGSYEIQANEKVEGIEIISRFKLWEAIIEYTEAFKDLRII